MVYEGRQLKRTRTNTAEKRMIAAARSLITKYSNAIEQLQTGELPTNISGHIR